MLLGDSPDQTLPLLKWQKDKFKVRWQNQCKTSIIRMVTDSSILTGTQHLPGLSVFQRSATLRSLLSGVPMGPKLEKGTELWLWVGGELGKLLGLEEWGDWLAGVEWSRDYKGRGKKVSRDSRSLPVLNFLVLLQILPSPSLLEYRRSVFIPSITWM